MATRRARRARAGSRRPTPARRCGRRRGRRPPVPAEPEAVAVRRLHPHARVQALVDEPVLGLEQQLLDDHGLTRPCHPSAHGVRIRAPRVSDASPDPDEARRRGAGDVLRPMATAPAATDWPQSAAAPSPFTPIADYAFLSDCHTGALVAPDGTIDWLCVPRFDAPSVFGSMLDRQAGGFRLGAYGVTVPATRRYEPGTNVLVTTWNTPGGWIEVRDALVVGPRGRPDTITPHTRPPADDDAAHALVRTVTCLDGAVEVELLCEPVFDYGREDAAWTLDEAAQCADATGAGVTVRLRTDMALGVEGGRVRARHVLRAGERAFCALSWAEGLAAPADADEADAMLTATAEFWRTWLDRARPIDHRWREPIERSALTIKGLTFMPTGRARRRPHHVAARDAGRRAQLGLPLRLDARRDVHAARAALARPRLGGRRVHAVRGRPRAGRRRRAADHVRDRRPPRPHRVDARRPVGLRRRAAGPDRQRRVRPAPERRLRRGARLDPAAHPAQPAAAAPAVADRRVAGDLRDQRLARARPGHLGGARRAAALRLVEAHGLGGARPRREARGDRGRGRARARRGRPPPRRSAPTSSSTASASAACCASTTGPTRSTPRTCWPRSSGSCPRRPRGAAGHRVRDRRRADRGRLRPALPDRGDRRRPVRQGGHVRDLLVLARVGAGRDRRAAARARPDGAAAAASPPRSGSTRRSSTPRPAGTSATSRRRSRTSRCSRRRRASSSPSGSTSTRAEWPPSPTAKPSPGSPTGRASACCTRSSAGRCRPPRSGSRRGSCRGSTLDQTGAAFARRRGDRGAQRDPAAGAGLAAAAVHGRHRLPARPLRRRVPADARVRRAARPHRRRRLRRRAAGRARDVGGEPHARGDPRHGRRRRVHAARDPPDRPPPGREGDDRRPRDRLPRDRRARAAHPARRDARRQRAHDGALGGRGRLRPDRVGDRPLVADRREPGRHPARLQRGDPRLPLGREGERADDRVLGAGRLRRDRAPASRPASACSRTAARAAATCSRATPTRRSSPSAASTPRSAPTPATARSSPTASTSRACSCSSSSRSRSS